LGKWGPKVYTRNLKVKEPRYQQYYRKRNKFRGQKCKKDRKGTRGKLEQASAHLSNKIGPTSTHQK